MVFHRSRLSSGLRVVSEKHSGMKAVSIGVFVLQGSRDESFREQGLSHFLEHLTFKGTETRNAYQIAYSLESLGGELNAYTGKEYTCYHALVLKDHWEKALDVLADLTCHMKIHPEDFAKEKQVVLQEMKMSEDQHDEMIFEHYFQKAFGNHGLAHPILGNPRSLKGLSTELVHKAYLAKYCGNRIIVSVAGDIPHGQIVSACKRLFSTRKKGADRPRLSTPRHRAFRSLIDKSAEQLHLLVGFPVSSFLDSDRFEAFLVNTALGGGMTSRLYQSVREERGLAYSIFSQLHTFFDTGLMTIVASSEPSKMPDILEVISEEMSRLLKDGISETELDGLKTQIRGALLLGADDVENRMTSIAINEMVFGRYKPVQQVIQEIQSVTPNRINHFLKKRLKSTETGVILLGGGARHFRSSLKKFLAH